jgi:r-opsin
LSSFQIVKAVVMHEAALKAQAKKMNVDSLRSNADEGKEGAEIRIAKVRVHFDNALRLLKPP